MKGAEQLSHQELADLVQVIVDRLFLDFCPLDEDEGGREEGHLYNPEKELDLRDTVHYLGELMVERGLAPQHRGDEPPAIENKDLAELERAERLAREVRDVLRKHGSRKAGPRAAALVKSIGGAIRNAHSRKYRPSQLEKAHA